MRANHARLRGFPLFDLDWSPDGTQVVSVGTDALVTIWDVTSQGDGGTPSRVLCGHSWIVSGVGWSPDGNYLASSGWDYVINLWDPASEASVQVIRDPDDPDIFFYGAAWSPDGQRLASGTFMHGVLV